MLIRRSKLNFRFEKLNFYGAKIAQNCALRNRGVTVLERLIFETVFIYSLERRIVFLFSFVKSVQDQNASKFSFTCRVTRWI